MSVLRRLLVFVAVLLGLSALSAQRPAAALSTEDVLFEIVSYYNPQLGQSQPLVHCIVHGGAVDSCATQFISTQARENPDVQRMLEVMDAYDKEQWHRVITLAGAGVACAWLDFPGEEVLCSDFVEVLQDAAEIASSAPSAALASIEALKDALPCVYNCGGDGFNAQAEWARCYAPRLHEAISLRLQGGDEWVRHIRGAAPNHTLVGGSLLGACYPQFTQANSIHNGLVDYLAQLNEPLRLNYIEQVEAAALDVLDEAAQDYANLQTLWTARPDPQARLALVAMLTSAGPIQPTIPSYVNSQRTACLATFDTAGAHMIDRWADSGARAGSTRAVRGLDAANWSTRKPREWCENYYVAQFAQRLTTRKTAYDEAIARGCRPAPRATPFVLQCPALGGGFQRCRAALDNIQNAQCTFIPINLRPIAPQQTPPNATEAPPPTTTTTPPQPRAPVLRPTRPNVLLPPTTPQPEERPPG